jgi:hypothetical protein
VYSVARIEDNITNIKQKIKDRKKPIQEKQTKKHISKIKKRLKNA